MNALDFVSDLNAIFNTYIIKQRLITELHYDILSVYTSRMEHAMQNFRSMDCHLDETETLHYNEGSTIEPLFEETYFDTTEYGHDLQTIYKCNMMQVKYPDQAKASTMLHANRLYFRGLCVDLKMFEHRGKKFPVLMFRSKGLNDLQRILMCIFISLVFETFNYDNLVWTSCKAIRFGFMKIDRPICLKINIKTANGNWVGLPIYHIQISHELIPSFVTLAKHYLVRDEWFFPSGRLGKAHEYEQLGAPDNGRSPWHIYVDNIEDFCNSHFPLNGGGYQSEERFIETSLMCEEVLDDDDDIDS